MEGSAMIELRNVRKRLGNAMILNGANLRVERGECVAVVGPSGSGKTTLLRLIAGLERPDSGSILLRGVEANRDGWQQPAFERAVGFQFQDSALWPHMSLLENLAYGLKGDKSRALECLERAGLKDLAGRRPAEVSGGEARRAALARALAPGRDIVLLDEPLTNLEAALRAEIGRWIAGELQTVHAACIWVTHDPSETEGAAGRVLTIKGGEMRETRPGSARA
jgi:ABC-type Fe3+/spermidine/putrescine transport system ATPase subunit